MMVTQITAGGKTTSIYLARNGEYYEENRTSKSLQRKLIDAATARRRVTEIDVERRKANQG